MLATHFDYTRTRGDHSNVVYLVTFVLKSGLSLEYCLFSYICAEKWTLRNLCLLFYYLYYDMQQFAPHWQKGLTSATNWSATSFCF